MKNSKRLLPEIIFEDDTMLVLNKPAGLVVHYDGKTKEPTVTDWLLKKYPKMKKVGEPVTLSTGEIIYRPGIVHRIDRETSGILVVAKTQEAFEFFKEQFKNREVRKTYHAFVYDWIKEETGVISKPIGRSSKDFRQWTVGRDIRGEERDAETHFTVIARGSDKSLKNYESKDGYTLLEVKPRTGRTHQIRVHFKSLHHPVICDKLYAPKREPALGFERLALHASAIEITTLKNKTESFTAPFPADFIEAQARLVK